MAAIKGDLTVLSLANLVQVLVQDRSTGLLTIEAGGERRILRISPSGIRLLRGSQRCHRLERVLRRSIGILSEPSDEFTLRVRRLVQEWMLEEVCELFTWSRGTFKYEKVDAGASTEEGPFGTFAADCDVTTVSIEAARWADELPRIKGVIRDLRQVPIRTNVAGPLNSEPFGAEAVDDVIRLIDGNRSVIQILQLSIFPRFIVLQVLKSLCQQAALRMTEAAPSAVATAAAA